MRFQTRYKQFSKPNKFIVELPQKIKTFKHSKWGFLQKKYFKILKNKKFRKSEKRKNPLILRIKQKKWERIKKAYKEGLEFKTSIITSFDNSITTRFLKKQLNLSTKKVTKEVLLNCLIKPCFRIDILLANLFFFKTTFHARQAINEGIILINFKKIKSNVFVKQGDIISFNTQKSDSFFYFNSFFINNKKIQKFYSFLEYDLYTKTIVVVKNFNDLTRDDLMLLVKDSMDLNTLKNYL